MSSFPTVSVIIPVYNGDRFLAEAIESVLAQTLPPHEIIVVDDGSTDNSSAVAAAYPVHLLRRPHYGLAATLNWGVQHARGEVLAFLDADDRWLPHKLAAQIAALQNNPTLAMVFAHCRQFTWPPLAHGPAEVGQNILSGVSRCTLLIRQTAFLQVGYFTEGVDKHDFLDWYARSLELKLQSIMLTEVLYERRIHDQNMGQRLRKEQRHRYLHSLRDIVTRRRADEATP